MQGRQGRGVALLIVLPAIALAIGGWLAVAEGLVEADDKARREAQAEGAQPAKELNGLPLLFAERFESADAANWEPSDPAAWKIIEQKGPPRKEPDQKSGNHVYSQFQQSKDTTTVRSPFNRALVKDLIVGDFVLDVQFQSTIKDYDHRDLCLFFGFQDPTHLYYVHFGKKADTRANQIFIVNNEPRKKISTESTAGTNWDDNWHHARVVRDVESGAIDVYFDDMEKPVMRAIDKTFTWGQVGIGSFDDTGNFDDVLVYGKKAEKK